MLEEKGFCNRTRNKDRTLSAATVAMKTTKILENISDTQKVQKKNLCSLKRIHFALTYCISYYVELSDVKGSEPMEYQINIKLKGGCL